MENQEQIIEAMKKFFENVKKVWKQLVEMIKVLWKEVKKYVLSLGRIRQHRSSILGGKPRLTYSELRRNISLQATRLVVNASKPYFTLRYYER